jgi:ABC-type multidrug transport system ATPase subunit/ABC-type transporter Mla maintaining outer membrane lipid asymmetry permease subunit MlaE
MGETPRPFALELRGFSLAHRTPNADVPLLEHVDLTVAQGGFYLLVGESGSGKSSLLRLICGLHEDRELPPRIAGEICVLGQPVTHGFPASLRGRVVAVLQDEGLFDELSPRANVELALRAAGRRRQLAPALLAQAGLDQPPDQVALLSGGMRKRAAIARALGTGPDLLLFDEPTAGLDDAAARQIARLLRDTGAGEGRTTIVISHDVDVFADLADAVVELDREQRTLRLTEARRLGGGRTWARSSFEAPTVPALRGVQRVLLEASALAHTLGESLLRLPPVYPGVVLRTVTRFVLEPALFVALVAVTIGALATFFALRNNPLEGAFQQQVLTGVGKVLVAVLVPLLAGFFFTARMAAGAAARIGTMKRTNQVAALEMLGVRPSDYLLTPLVWAMCVAMPVVAMAGIAGGCLASLLTSRAVAGVPAFGWAVGFFRTVDAVDLRIVLLKTVLSGFLVALLTYHLAMAPKRSGRDVGDAVNSSIVLGMVAVLAVHGTLTFLAYD